MKQVLNIAELRALARRRLPRVIWDYVEGGAEDEVTLRANRAAFARLCFAPRSLVDVSGRSLKTTLFGKPYDVPFGIAPMGACGLVRRDADIALAQAARIANLPFVLSTHSFVSLPQVAQVSGIVPWFQLYLSPERKGTRQMLAQAEQAGCDTLVLTTDVPVGGNREYNERNGFGIPLRLSWSNMMDGLAHPRWLAGVFPGSTLLARANATAAAAWSERRDALNWRDLLWLRDTWKGKLVVKGILHPDDALRAADLGADGIVVSNHGGRQLDGAPSTLQVLPAIAAALQGRIALIADSGFRRGSDIVKAIALGADFVLVGRPALYGAAVAGAQGVLHALHILATEMNRTLALIGCSAIADLAPHFLMMEGEALPLAQRPTMRRLIAAVQRGLS